jgi:hypothetical protein
LLWVINTGTWPSRLGESKKIEIVKYGHESRGTQTQERLPWRCPATTENYRLDLSSEKASHIKESVTSKNNFKKEKNWFLVPDGC